MSDDIGPPTACRERTEHRALKAFVPMMPQELGITFARLTMTLDGSVPGAAPELKEMGFVTNVPRFGEVAADPVAASAAFAATVAMAEADAERTWAHDKKRAAKMIAKLGITWTRCVCDRIGGEGEGEGEGALQNGRAAGLGSAFETYLDQRCAEKWRAMGLTENKFYAVTRAVARIVQGQETRERVRDIEAYGRVDQ